MFSDDYQNMMRSILYEWDSSIFICCGGVTFAGYTKKQYNLMGYNSQREFETDKFFEEFNYNSYRENLGSFDNAGKTLTNEDKELLIEHSDYLFNGIEDEKKLYKYMLKLALYLNHYRYLGTRKNVIKKIYKPTYKSSKKNYSKAEKVIKIRKIAEQLKSLMGNIHHGTITEELNKVIQSPNDYIENPLDPKILRLQDIKNYLSNLQLKKQDNIKNFVADIQNI